MKSARTLREPSIRFVSVRAEVIGLATLIVIAAAGAGFAFAFRHTGAGALAVLTGAHDPTRAASRLHPLLVGTIVTVASAAAAFVGHRVARTAGGRLGLTALARSARLGSAPPSLLATLTRASGTWIASFAMVSVGRESAILETAGAVGATADRKSRWSSGAFTAGGIAAAFAAAYHAPIAAVLYVEEHVGIRRQPRAIAYAVIGAAVSRLLLTAVFEAHPIFPRHEGDLAGAAVLGAAGLVPAALAARLFLRIRDRTAVAARDRLPPLARVAVLAAVAGAVVAAAPLTAGNGMEALRFAAQHPSITVALALAAGKLFATTAALASGVPGGAFSPTMALSAGSALGVYLAVAALGVGLPTPLWDGVLLAMVVGIAVGLQAPLTAAFAVPEMAGDYSLLPLAVVVAAAASAFDRLIDRRVDRWRSGRTPWLHDEDA